MEQPTEPATDNPLADLLHHAGLSPERLIARINERRRRRGSHPLDPKSAYPWLRPHPARPTQDNQTDALAVLSARTGHTVTAQQLGWTGPRRRPRRCIDAPGEAPVSDLLREIGQGEPVERRNLLLLAGTTVTAPALALLITADNPLDNHRGEHPPPQLAANIENAVRELRTLDDSDGSTTALTWASGLWQSTARVITTIRGDNPTTRRVHQAFIELCEQFGWMLFDDDRQPQAQRVYQSGMSLAREATSTSDIRSATGNLLASAAYQASWLAQHSEAKSLLDAAQRISAGSPPRLRAVIADRAVFAAGRRGDTEALRRARDSAHDHLDQTGHDIPWWSQWLSHHAIDAATGRAWLAARAPDTAEPYLTRRLETVSAETYPRDRMLAILDLADTQRLRGDLTTARSLTRQAHTLTDRVESPRARNRLHEVTNAFPQHP
ncbi:XRE family transcriptional regulator [Streptomyces celluloflavus]|uniref:XRE family transcriptional regulator n=1 Tax=Streptomyces celluloflavus TaxID=58344 RepID=UPI0036B96FE8